MPSGTNPVLSEAQGREIVSVAWKTSEVRLLPDVLVNVCVCVCVSSQGLSGVMQWTSSFFWQLFPLNTVLLLSSMDGPLLSHTPAIPSRLLPTVALKLTLGEVVGSAMSA